MSEVGPHPGGASTAPEVVLDSGSSWRWVVVRVVLVAWAFVVLGYAAGLAFTGAMGDLGCENPSGSSNYGELVFHALPPGLECRYGPNDVDGPGLGTAVFQLVLVAIPVAAWRFSRRLAPEPRHRLRREMLDLVLAVTILTATGLAIGSFVAGETSVLLPFFGAAVLTAIAAASALAWGRWRSRDHDADP